MKLFFFILITTISTQVSAQRFSIDKIKFRIVSLDPIAKRAFVAYDYMFPSEAPTKDSFLIKNMKYIKDSVINYVKCIFNIENISFFKSAAYAKYAPIDKKENIEWGKEYIGELNIVTNEYTRFPVLKRKTLH
jgi:hypothetical protein